MTAAQYFVVLLVFLAALATHVAAAIDRNRSTRP